MSAIDNANGYRPEGLLDLLHPALQSAQRPDRDKLGFDLDEALRSVVRLHAEVPSDAFTAPILGTEREGSGTVLDDKGLVLTIGYLITESNAINLTLSDGKAVPGEAVAYDHETGFGLVRALEPLDVPPLAIGDSGALAEGDDVVVASFGGYSHAIAGRVVSRREFAGSWEYMLDHALYTIPMHPYWGGSALLDSAGRLVGTGSLYIEQSIPGEGTMPGNMFVPIDLLKPILDDMLATGRARRKSRPWLGMYTAEAMDRLVVTGVADNGPADKSGVEPGDVVLSVEGVPVKGLAEMYRTVWGAGAAGDEIRFTLLRDDDVITVRVQSGDRYSYLNLPRRH